MLLLLALLGAGPFIAPPQPAILPGSPRQGMVALDPAWPEGLSACEDCHPRIAAEHAASRHAVAADNPSFRVSWQALPDGWCLGCHMPLASEQVRVLGRRAVPGARTEGRSLEGAEGVTCAVCHLRAGTVLTAGEPSVAARAAHPIQRDRSLGSPAFCADCHEFPLQEHHPRWPLRLSQTPAQSTVSEWQEAGLSRDCVDCHMGRSGHRFPGAHDLDLLRRSVSVQARPQGSELLLTLQTRGVGHAMPSGDPFRSLELEACADPDCQQVLHRVALGRRLRRTPTGWVDHEDSRIPPPQGRAPAQRTVTLPAQGVVAWRLSYRLVDARHEALLPPEEARLLLHQGLLP